MDESIVVGQTHLFNNPGQSTSLEPAPAVPFITHRYLKALLVLLLARVRVRQVLELELRRLPVLLLCDDNVGVGKILSGSRLDTGRLDEELGVGLALLCTLAAP